MRLRVLSGALSYITDLAATDATTTMLVKLLVSVGQFQRDRRTNSLATASPQPGPTAAPPAGAPASAPPTRHASFPQRGQYRRPGP
ncbi:hypothetical protein AB0M36_28245 [Actinoplanes sp. NPDC051346]|uniref:hypothetical protein n=1 Tax=Actinoplanes sp. NPDC051346 TaxID=3155048 RepID=UPI0034179D09